MGEWGDTPPTFDRSGDAWGASGTAFDDGAEGGGAQYIELLGAQLWVAGMINLGRFRRVSDFVNIAQGYLVMHDVVVLTRAGEATRLTLDAFWRDGDIVTYAAAPRPDLVSLASHTLAVDTFKRPLDAYSIDARTAGAKLGCIRALDESSAVIISYEWRRTEHSVLHFINQSISLSFVHQF